MRGLFAAMAGLALGTSTTHAATPDPLAVGIIYEVHVSYSEDSNRPTRVLQKKQVDAVVRCLIENRSEETLKPVFLWQYATRAAAIIRAKGVAGSMWPIAPRLRALKGRMPEFAFTMSGKMASGYPVNGTFNAMKPGGFRRLGVPREAIELDMGVMGLPDLKVCAAPERPPRPVNLDNEEVEGGPGNDW